MSKFKVGDTVECVKGWEHYLIVGEKYVVSELIPRCDTIRLEGMEEYAFFESRFKLVAPKKDLNYFRVGDKVIVNEDAVSAYGSRKLKPGVHTISKIEFSTARGPVLAQSTKLISFEGYDLRGEACYANRLTHYMEKEQKMPQTDKELQDAVWKYLTTPSESGMRTDVLRDLVDRDFFALDEGAKEVLERYLDENPRRACSGGITRFKAAVLPPPVQTVEFVITVNVEDFTGCKERAVSALSGAEGFSNVSVVDLVIQT